MSRLSDIKYGRQGGRFVSAPTPSVDEIREQAIEAGTWPTDDDQDDGDEQASLFDS